MFDEHRLTMTRRPFAPTQVDSLPESSDNMRLCSQLALTNPVAPGRKSSDSSQLPDRPSVSSRFLVVRNYFLSASQKTHGLAPQDRKW
jgi:hypothetical protein